ncbi:hypothetical protein NLI96_g11356 [Meripilus lineatus]|uniref:F-box domain-containing protein n=1 Tax=Meripilus lineatus TaxID=2056292 RepID=A0AAD5URX4_9APHY|nr:hypothetical protein NLI96_g11356 [Physisporinus lineatus]
MKTLPELPQELTDLIIDNLHSDLISLRACTLTCHSWLHRSRRLLHSRVRIGEYFVDLDRYSDPNVAHYVRELELYMVVSGHTCQRVTTEPLWQMISRFPSVNTLTIRDLEVPRLSPNKMSILQTLCKQLRSLTLINVEFKGPDQFIEFIDSCDQLTHLNIPRIKFFDRHADIDALAHSLSSLAESGSPIPGHRIKCLSLGTFSDHVTTTVELWFAALVASGSLQASIISRDACIDGPVNFDPIFSAIGPSSMDLQISCKGGTRYKNKADTGINHCPNLRSITFISPPDYTPTAHSPYTRSRGRPTPSSASLTTSQHCKQNQLWILPLLSQVVSPSHRLRTITFQVHWSTTCSVNSDFLSQVSNILTKRTEAFGGLKELILIVQHHFGSGSPFRTRYRPRSSSAGENDSGARTKEERQQMNRSRDKKFKLFVEVTVRYRLADVIKKGVVVLLDFPQGGGSLRITTDTLQDLSTGFHLH